MTNEQSNHKVKRVHVIADKLTNEEEDHLNYFLRTLKKEGSMFECKCKPNTCQYNPILGIFQCYSCGGKVTERKIRNDR